MAKRDGSSKQRARSFRGFMDLMSEMNRAQSQFLRQHSGDAARSGQGYASAYVPPADIFAQGDDLYIRCEVSGVRRDSISVTITSGVLTIAGERDSELDEAAISYYARERTYGEFRRDMLLPEGVTSENVVARTRNGLLEVVIAGGASGRTASIAIADDDESE